MARCPDPHLARTLERGIIDGIYIADVVGYYDVYQGCAWHAIQQAAQIPVNDPIQLVSAMALVTRNLGFGITASTGFEHPYTFARRLSTADHLSGRPSRRAVLLAPGRPANGPCRLHRGEVAPDALVERARAAASHLMIRSASA